MKRNRAIDYEKGFIVAVMVFCHVLQYFGRTDIYPEQQWLILAVCAMAFPTFVFAYGRSVYLAYYSRDFKTAAPRMVGSIVRSYLAFCVSGIANNVLCSGKSFNLTTIKKVFLLKDIPGMSEFLAAFAALGLVALVLFPVFKWLLERPVAHWIVALACFLSAFIPYDRIRDPRLGLLIGSSRFYLFPVLQYLPFFLAGLYVERYGMKKPAIWLLVSAVFSGVSVAYTVMYGQPGRFPPTLLWLIMPCVGIVLLNMLAEELDKMTAERKWGRQLLGPAASMGRNSLYYLVTSNLILFTASCLNGLGYGILPAYRKSAKFPFQLETCSTPWALFWTLVMLLCIGFVGGLHRKARRE